MIIKIKSNNSLSYKNKMGVITQYISENESTDVNHDGWMNSINIDYDIKLTGKYPVIVSVGSRNYYVKCRKTKTSYVFDVWNAV